MCLGLRTFVWHTRLLIRIGNVHCSYTLLEENVQNIFDTLTINSPTGSQTKYSVTLDALNEHFIPKRNLEYELFMFRSGKQENDETLDQFQHPTAAFEQIL